MTEATERPAWWRCTSSTDRRFTPGVVYEVYEYDRMGRAVVVTEFPRRSATLPVSGATFEPHDSHAGYRARAAQGGEA